jgi:hypothetical protein
MLASTIQAAPAWQTTSPLAAREFTLRSHTTILPRVGTRPGISTPSSCWPRTRHRHRWHTRTSARRSCLTHLVFNSLLDYPLDYNVFYFYKRSKYSNLANKNIETVGVALRCLFFLELNFPNLNKFYKKRYPRLQYQINFKMH